MAGYVPFTDTRLPDQEPAVTTTGNEVVDELMVPHALELIAHVQARVTMLIGLTQQAKRLIASKQNPLNPAMAEIVIDKIERDLIELKNFAELG